MIRPRSGLSVPSQNTLCFLRQIVFPRSSEPKWHCLHATRRKKIYYGGAPERCLYHEATTTRSREDHQPQNIPPVSSTVPISAQNSSKTEVTNEKKEKNSKIRRWKTLIARGKIYDARQQFFRFRDDGIEEPLMQELGYNLMLVCHQYGRFADIPLLFQYLQRGGLRNISTASFNLCLESHRRSGYYTKLIKIFKDLNESISPNAKTYELYIEALVEVGHLVEAKELIWILERKSYVTIGTFARFLRGWGKVSTFDSFVCEFKYIQMNFKGELPVLLWNIVIEEALLVGNCSAAKQYLDEMLDTGIKPDGDTYGAFVNLQAILQDYVGVAKTMEHMKANGLGLSTPKLNQMLISYARNHGATDLEQFFDVLLREGAPPSTTSYNIMVKKNVDERNWTNIIEWVKSMKQAGFRPNMMTFKLLVKVLWNTRPQHTGPIWLLIKQVFRMNKSLVSRSMTQEDLPAQFKGRLVVDVSHAEEDSRKLFVVKDMKYALQEERIFDAIRIFRESLVFAHPTSDLLQLAARAYILIPDTGLVVPERDLRHGIPVHDEANRLIFETISRNVETEIGHDEVAIARETIRKLVFSAYKLMDFHNMPILHTICVRAASAFINARDPYSAVHLMNDVSKTQWGRKAPWDIDALTVLLRSYAMIGDIRGIVWVVNRMIECRLPTDKSVMKYMKNATKVIGNTEARKVIGQLISKARTHRFITKTRMNKYARTYLQLLADPDADMPGRK